MNRKLLVQVISLVVLLHVGVILLLQDMEITYYLPHTTFLDRFVRSSEDSSQDLAKVQEKRNQQLAAIFQELKRPPAESSHLNYDLKNLKAESSLPLQIDHALPTALALEEMEFQLPESNAHEIAMAALHEPFQLPAMEGLATIPHASSLLSVDVKAPQEDALVQELVQATEALRGCVTESCAELLATDSAIQAGNLQEKMLQGNWLTTRSGMLESCPTENTEGSGNLFSSADLGSYRQEINASPMQTFGNLFPQAPISETQKAMVFPRRAPESTRADNGSLTSIASSNDFHLKVDYAKRPDASGYLFRIQLEPKEQVLFKHIKQNYCFLLDRSHSIDSERYERSKDAVLQALMYLQDGDAFNIVVFDKNAVRLAQRPLTWNPENIAKARQFLKSQEYGGILARTDLYSSLGSIVPEIVADNEVNSVILLSDGDTYLKTDEQRHMIGNWTRHNAGKVSLYCIAGDRGDNLPLLDVLSNFNKGALFYTVKGKSIEETLLSLMEKIQHPIGKGIVPSAVSIQGNQIDLFPSAKRLPNLFENQPYVVYGTTNDLNDFYVFFQGRYYDKWLDIKQLVSFEHAQQIDSAPLERMWAIHEAYESYARFLIDGHPSHLTYAKNLLAPYRIPLAFQ